MGANKFGREQGGGLLSHQLPGTPDHHRQLSIFKIRFIDDLPIFYILLVSSDGFQIYKADSCFRSPASHCTPSQMGSYIFLKSLEDCEHPKLVGSRWAAMGSSRKLYCLLFPGSIVIEKSTLLYPRNPKTFGKVSVRI
jgi:hypothetical protein